MTTKEQPSPLLTDDEIDAVISDSGGHWVDDLFKIEAADLKQMLRAVEAAILAKQAVPVGASDDGMPIAIRVDRPEGGVLGPNELEAFAKLHPDDYFLKGSGVLRLIAGIRTLEQSATPQEPVNARPTVEVVEALQELLDGIHAGRFVPFNAASEGYCGSLVSAVESAITEAQAMPQGVERITVKFEDNFLDYWSAPIPDGEYQLVPTSQPSAAQGEAK